MSNTSKVQTYEAAMDAFRSVAVRHQAAKDDFLGRRITWHAYYAVRAELDAVGLVVDAAEAELNS